MPQQRNLRLWFVTENDNLFTAWSPFQSVDTIRAPRHLSSTGRRIRDRRMYVEEPDRSTARPLPRRAIICLHNYIKLGILHPVRLWLDYSIQQPTRRSDCRCCRSGPGLLAGAHLNFNVLFFTYNVSHIHTVNTTHNKSVWGFLVRSAPRAIDLPARSCYIQVYNQNNNTTNATTTTTSGPSSYLPSIRSNGNLNIFTATRNGCVKS